MYTQIWSPLKQEFVPTLSYDGKKSLKMYVNSFMTGGADAPPPPAGQARPAATTTAGGDAVPPLPGATQEDTLAAALPAEADAAARFVAELPGGSNIDTRMRYAFELYKKYCDELHFELTPAYDMTTLIAMVTPNKGEVITDIPDEEVAAAQEKYNNFVNGTEQDEIAPLNFLRTDFISMVSDKVDEFNIPDIGEIDNVNMSRSVLSKMKNKVASIKAEWDAAVGEADEELEKKYEKLKKEYEELEEEYEKLSKPVTDFAKIFAAKNVWKLKEQYVKNPEELMNFQTDVDTASSLPKNLVIFTDYGEEADDEVTCFMANLLKDKGVNVLLVHCAEDENSFDAEKTLYEQRGGKCDFIPIKELKEARFKEFIKKEANQVNCIVQIGPIREKHWPNWMDNALEDGAHSYTYYLEGLLGSTFNSKGDAKENAEKLCANATEVVICDAAQGNGAYKWRLDFVKQAALNALGASATQPLEEAQAEAQAEALCARVMNIGWRNTVGRAAAFKVGKFIAHLVVPHKGANYKVVKGIVDKIDDERAAFKVGDKEMTDIKNVVDTYIFNLLRGGGGGAMQLYMKDVDMKDVDWNDVTMINIENGSYDQNKTNSRLNITIGDIKEGYTYILKNLYKFFGVPIKLHKSGEPGKWEPYWETPSRADLENGRVESLFPEPDKVVESLEEN